MKNITNKLEKRFPKPVAFIREISEIWVSERPNQLAAALAYFGLFSFAPVIYIALTIAGIFIDQAAALERFLTRVESTLGSGASQTVQDLLKNVSSTSSESTFLFSLISFLLLLITASGVFLQLQYALNRIWNVAVLKEGALKLTVRQRLFSFLMVISLGLLLVLGSVASVVTTWISSMEILSCFLPAITFFSFATLATVSFGVMYKLLPAVKIGWRDVWIGALVAASLVTILGGLIIFFMENTNISSALEAAGSFVVLLSGFYYFAQIFILGAVITRIYAHRYGSMRPQPVDPAHVEENPA